MLINPAFLALATVIAIVTGKVLGMNPHLPPIFVAGAIGLVVRACAVADRAERFEESRGHVSERVCRNGAASGDIGNLRRGDDFRLESYRPVCLLDARIVLDHAEWIVHRFHSVISLAGGARTPAG